MFLNFIRRDIEATVEHLCSSYQCNTLPYGAHSENYVLDALLSCIFQQTLVHRHTHAANCCSVLLKISWYLPYSMHACIYMCIHIYICIYFLQHFLWVLLSISVTCPFLFPSANAFVAYSTERTCRYPVQLEPLGGAILLAEVAPVFSPPLGVAPSLVIYKALSLPFLNSGIAHLQMTYTHATSGSSVSCHTTLLTRKSSTVWPYFTTLGALGANVLLPGYTCWEKDNAREEPAPGLRRSQSDRHIHSQACCCYQGTEVIRISKGCFLHVWLCRLPLSRTAC